MSLFGAINKNRFRQARFKRAEKVLRNIRFRIFDYEDSEKLEKAERIMEKCRKILKPLLEQKERNKISRNR